MNKVVGAILYEENCEDDKHFLFTLLQFFHEFFIVVKFQLTDFVNETFDITHTYNKQFQSDVVLTDIWEWVSEGGFNGTLAQRWLCSARKIWVMEWGRCYQQKN